MATIFQSDLLVNFLYPFLLIFIITYAVLEKTKILGEGQRTINAWVSVIIAAIFVGAVFPKVIVENMVLFMTVGLVVIFVGLILWGFISGKGTFAGSDGKVPKIFIAILAIAFVFALILATGVGKILQPGLAFLFDSQWSGTFWSNFLFVAIVAVAIATVLKFGAAAEGGKK